MSQSPLSGTRSTQFSQDLPTTGIIGVGLLGMAMAQRLLQGFVPVCGFDPDATRLNLLAKANGDACGSVEQLVQSCDMVILSLPTAKIVRQVLGAHQDDFRNGQVVIDTTTGAPHEAEEHARLLEALGAHYIEANVAGSSAQMLTGDVVLLLGGATEPIHQVQPLMELLTKKHFHLGPVGSASKLKLVHNLILGLHRAVLAEGLTFAESLGIDPVLALSILQQTPAASAVMETKGQQMATGEYPVQAKLSQHLKDVRVILEEASRAGASTPLSELHLELLEQAERLGYGEADNSAVMELFRARRKTSS